jgi:hypothetical protein
MSAGGHRLDQVSSIINKIIFTGFGKPDFEVAGNLRVRLPRHNKKNAYSYPQAYPQPRKVAGRLGKFVVKQGSFLFQLAMRMRSLPRSVVDDDGSQECIPSCHGRTTT